LDETFARFDRGSAAGTGIMAKVASALVSTTSKGKASAGKTSVGKTRQSSWTQDPEGVRRNILDAARREFVDNGLSGARVDEIAARTATSKRMIYYYFGDKEGLYRAVLEEMYERIRGLERSLDLASLPPDEAITLLAGFTFDYHAENADFVRLVMVENIHHARHLATSDRIAALNLSAIDMIREAYERGADAGLFRRGIAAIDIHLTMSALAFYNVSNQASIRQVFGHDMSAPEIMARRRAMTIDAVMGMLRRTG
jgi:AcrR family transcriptional regulator